MRALALTFDLGVQHLQIILIVAHEPLLELACPHYHLADFLRLFFIGQRTYSVSWNDVFEYCKLGEKCELADDEIVGDRFRVVGRRDGRKREGV